MIPVWIIASFQKIDAHSGTKFQSSLYLSYTGSQRSNIRKKCAMNEELLDLQILAKISSIIVIYFIAFKKMSEFHLHYRPPSDDLM